MRLIDADALDLRWESPSSYYSLMNAPTVPDAEVVVRCKDCKWFNNIGCAIQIDCEEDKPKEMDYCSFGEKEE